MIVLAPVRPPNHKRLLGGGAATRARHHPFRTRRACHPRPAESSTPGHAFTLVPATGEEPLIFAASNLALDAKRHHHRLAQEPGETKVELEVKSTAAHASESDDLSAASRKWCLRRPWAELLELWLRSDAAAADAMAKRTAALMVFQYVNIDDCGKAAATSKGIEQLLRNS